MKTKEYWEAQARKSVAPEAENLFGDYWTRRYLQNFKYLGQGRRILDIGCGNARYFVKLADRFEEFYGVELSSVHFDLAKRFFPEGNYVVADAGKLAFRDSCFDVIISFGAFEHNQDIDTIFRECCRVLDKDGILLFSVPNYISPWFPWVYIAHTFLEKHDRVAAIGHHYGKNNLRRKLERAGFKEVRVVDSIYAAPIPIVSLANGLAKRVTMLVSGKSQVKREALGGIKNNASQSGRIAGKLDYYWSKAFYPLERLGVGFMRVLLCRKN